MLNQIVIMGRMVRDPELRRTAAGTACANFTVAVERDFGQNGGEKETDFIDCVAWKQTAEFVSKYFTKGKQIALSGRLQIRSWTDKDGNKRKTAEIVAANVYFAGSKNDGAGQTGNSGYGGAGSYGGNAYGGYGGGGVSAGTEDYGMLTDDDAQLPF